MATYTANTGEGRVSGSNAAWATIRGASAGSTEDGLIIVGSSLIATDYYIFRSFFPFNTAAIPDNATVTAATLKVYRDDTVTAFLNENTTSLEVVVQTQADETNLGTGDFDQVSFTSKGSLNFASTSNETYATITISDLSIISKTGYTKLALISGKDLADSAPAGRNEIGFQDRGDANPPTLTVTYTLPGGKLNLTSKFW